MKATCVVIAVSIAVLSLDSRGESAQAKPGRDASPKIEARPLQPYVAVRLHTSMRQLGKAIPAGIEQVGAWLGVHRVRSAGPPFVRYRVIDMPKLLEIEIGFPVSGSIKVTEPMVSGAFPAGRYVTYTYIGSPAGLAGANAIVLGWARRNHLSLDQTMTKKGVAWGSRAEIYLTDPAREPDPNNYKTRIIIRMVKYRG